LHAIMIYERPMQRNKLQQNIWNRYVKCYSDTGTIGGIAVKVQVAPGPRWYEEYLRKEEDVVEKASKWDVDAVKVYFPDEHTQEFLQAAKGSGGNWVAKLLDDYKSQCNDYTFHSAYVFLHKQHRLQCRFFQYRTLREHAKILANFANEVDEPTMECVRWNNQMDGQLLH